MSDNSVRPQAFNEALAPMVSALLSIADAYTAAAADKGLPFSQSSAMRDLASQDRFAKLPGAQPVDNAHSLLRLLTFAGFDHLRSFARLFQGNTAPVFSHLVLARAALQAFGPAAWLAEPGITTERRVKRILLLDLEDAANRKRYGLATIKNTARPITDHVRALVAELGWQAIFNQTTQSVGGEALPSTTDLIAAAIGPGAPNPPEDALQEHTPRLVWSYLSGVAHGFSYALLQSITRGEQSLTTPGLVAGTLGTDTSAVIAMASAIASAAYTAGERHLSYMGWKGPAWDKGVSALQQWIAPIVGRLDTGQPE